MYYKVQSITSYPITYRIGLHHASIQKCIYVHSLKSQFCDVNSCGNLIGWKNFTEKLKLLSIWDVDKDEVR